VVIEEWNFSRLHTIDYKNRNIEDQDDK